MEKAINTPMICMRVVECFLYLCALSWNGYRSSQKNIKRKKKFSSQGDRKRKLSAMQVFYAKIAWFIHQLKMNVDRKNSYLQNYNRIICQFHRKWRLFLLRFYQTLNDMKKDQKRRVDNLHAMIQNCNATI